MAHNRPVKEQKLAALAKKFRVASGKSKVDVARELGVAPPTIFGAEEQPELSLTKLRIRIIEACSPFKVVGPVFLLKGKQSYPDSIGAAAKKRINVKKKQLFGRTDST